MRLIFVTVTGFIFCIFMMNNYTTAEFFCDRYSYLDYENEDHSKKEWDQCVHDLRISSWFVLILSIVVQLHCCWTLVKYRISIENPDREEKSDEV